MVTFFRGIVVLDIEGRATTLSKVSVVDDVGHEVDSAWGQALEIVDWLSRKGYPAVSSARYEWSDRHQAWREVQS